MLAWAQCAILGTPHTATTITIDDFLESKMSDEAHPETAPPIHHFRPVHRMGPIPTQVWEYLVSSIICWKSRPCTPTRPKLDLRSCVPEHEHEHEHVHAQSGIAHLAATDAGNL